MTIETGLGLASALLLAAAGLAGALALYRARDRHRWWVPALRLGAILALAATLAVAAMAHGEWSPSDLRQGTLAAVLAALIVQSLLSWRLGIDGAGPVADLVAMSLVLLSLFGIRAGGPTPLWLERTLPYQAAWLLLSLGAGSTIVAGSTGLRIGLQSLPAQVHRRPWTALGVGLNTFLEQATALALGLLGSGLLIRGWWSWQTVGRLAGGDPREEWLAATWLAAAASLIAWRLSSRRWAAVLALVAAAAVLLGLLAIVDLRRWLGMAG